MNPITAFVNLPIEPLLSEENPAVRALVRDRGFSKPMPYPVVSEQPGETTAIHLPSDDLLRRQLEFEGKSPLEVADLLAQARIAEQASRRLATINDALSGINSHSRLERESEVHRVYERKSRVASWWRFASRHMVMWSAVAAAALAVATALLARQGSSLDPILIAGIAIVIALTVYAGFAARQRSIDTIDTHPEHSSAVWSQTVAAFDYQSAQSLLQEASDLIDSTLTTVSGSLGGILTPLTAARDQLQETASDCYWSYRNIVLAARDEVASGSSATLHAPAERQLEALTAAEAHFAPPSGGADTTTHDERFRVSSNLASDRTVAVALSSLFALTLSPAILGLPAAAIANDKCSYAIAEVRIDLCEDITGLDAVNLSLPKVDFQDRDVSGSDFQGADLTEATLTDADLSYTNLSNSILIKAVAQRANFNGASATSVNLTEANLTESVMTGVDLTGALLTDGTLRDADFSGSILSNADITNANASQASFINTDATRVDFSEANLTDALFINADLTGANFEKADLAGADFTGATLSGIDFASVDFSEATLDGVDLSGVDLSGLDLSGYSLLGADLSGANLTNTSLEDANLVDADLTGATITGLKLAGATLGGVSVKALLDGGADLEGVDLSGADLSGLAGAEINLPGATLNGVDLAGFDLTGANLDGASLEGANLDGAVLSEATFVDADLSGASLVESEMSQATFTGAQFTGADLTNARALDSDFAGASFIGAELQGADFSESNMRQARGLGSNAAQAQWVDAICPGGQQAEICRS